MGQPPTERTPGAGQVFLSSRLNLPPMPLIFMAPCAHYGMAP